MQTKLVTFSLTVTSFFKLCFFFGWFRSNVIAHTHTQCQSKPIYFFRKWDIINDLSFDIIKLDRQPKKQNQILISEWKFNPKKFDFRLFAVSVDGNWKQFFSNRIKIFTKNVYSLNVKGTITVSGRIKTRCHVRSQSHILIECVS